MLYRKHAPIYKRAMGENAVSENAVQSEKALC